MTKPLHGGWRAERVAPWGGYGQFGSYVTMNRLSPEVAGVKAKRGKSCPAQDHGTCKFFCAWAIGNGGCCQFPVNGGRRPSNTMAKWFNAAFQPTIGIVHFFDAS